MDARKEAAGKLDDILREIDIQKQLLERLQKQYDVAEKKFNREKQLTECCVTEVQQASNRWDLEKKKFQDLDRKNQEISRQNEETKSSNTRNEQTFKKTLKNAENSQKRLQEEVDELKETNERKLLNEKKRGEQIQKDYDQKEQERNQERDRRVEAEKKRDEYRARLG